MPETNPRLSACSICLALLCIALVAAGPAAAQNTTATITGLVLDEQGLRVPGATVAVRDASRGLSRTTMSGEDGAFELAGCSPASTG